MVQTKSLRFNKKFIIPSVLLVWLLVSLSFTVLISPADATHECPHDKTEAMTDVYSPERFRILNLCQSASGKVTHFELWGDGDWNVYVKLDEASRNLVDSSGISKLQAWEQARKNEGADMIWEAIPRDHQEGDRRLDPCTPTVGAQTTVTGVYVADKWHGWKEIHPITQITSGTQTCTREPVSSTESSGGGDQCKDSWGWGPPKCRK